MGPVHQLKILSKQSLSQQREGDQTAHHRGSCAGPSETPRDQKYHHEGQQQVGLSGHGHRWCVSSPAGCVEDH